MLQEEHHTMFTLHIFIPRVVHVSLDQNCSRNHQNEKYNKIHEMSDQSHTLLSGALNHTDHNYITGNTDCPCLNIKISPAASDDLDSCLFGNNIEYHIQQDSHWVQLYKSHILDKPGQTRDTCFHVSKHNNTRTKSHQVTLFIHHQILCLVYTFY